MIAILLWQKPEVLSMISGGKTKAQLTASPIFQSPVPPIRIPDPDSIEIQIILPASLPIIRTVLTHLNALPNSSKPQFAIYQDSMLIVSITVTGAASKLLPNRSITSTTADPFIPFNLFHYIFSRLTKLNLDENSIPTVVIQSETEQAILSKKPKAILPEAAEDSGLETNSG